MFRQRLLSTFSRYKGEVKGHQLFNTLKRTEICSVLNWKNIMYIVCMWRKGFSVSMVNGLWARLPGNRGSIPEGAEVFRHLLLTTFTEHQSNSPLVQWIPRCLPAVLKCLEFEADNLNPQGSKGEISWSCTSLYSITIHLLHATNLPYIFRSV